MTSLRAWAVEIYARPGVADACLVLQDRWGLDVNLVLFAMWRGPAPDVLQAAGDLSARFAPVTAGIRSARRALKARPPAAPPDLIETARSRLKAIELEIELAELDALERIAPPPSRPDLGADYLRDALYAAFPALSEIDAARADLAALVKAVAA